MSSISAVGQVPPPPMMTEIAPIRPVAPKTAPPQSSVAQGPASQPTASSNPPGVGRLLDIRA